MNSVHTFQIPVMGTAFTVDTPVKTAKYGISSVISLVDDCLIEDMRKFYCGQTGEAYTPITKNDEDFRARRITEYLNLLDRIIKKQIEEVRASPFEPDSEITKYFELLPKESSLASLYQIMLKTTDAETKTSLQEELRKQVKAGDINVNIMTKLDRSYFDKDGNELPQEHCDALAAFRGYAKSTLNSAIVFSAGFNRRLYTYIEQFKDFYADAKGFIKKRIILKVSDFRSSITQGKFLAKKGLWVSEYRIESGLNCGGHAFASNGFLMGPIMEEFKQKKQELILSLHKIYTHALKIKEKFVFAKPHPVKITAQGGIGTSEENQFLFSHYQVDGTGWGTPFLFVPEVTNVDEETLEKLIDGKEDDFYLSDISPLNVPFNNLRQSLSDTEKDQRKDKGIPGSACPKKYLVSNTEFTKEPICIASRLYQKLKIDQLTKDIKDEKKRQEQIDTLTKKACICNDLGASAYLKNKIQNKIRSLFTAICPGPGAAYFSRIATLKEMTNHIYGRINLIHKNNRPHMFITELTMYVDYFKKEVQKAIPSADQRQIANLIEFKNNLLAGVEYYKKLFNEKFEGTEEKRKKILDDLKLLTDKLTRVIDENMQILVVPGIS